MKKISFTLLAMTCLFSAFSQTRATFENLSLAPNSYYNGSNLAGGFLSGDAYFYNTYDTSFGGFWSGGFAYSNVKNDTTPGSSNEYAAAPASGVFGSANYAVATIGLNAPVVALRGFATGQKVYGFYVTNNTYAYLSMKNGDAFAKKFGGVTGTDPDWFRLTVGGWYNGSVIANSVDFYLADFRSPDTTQHYILKSWQFVNLESLGNVDSLFFQLNSSDTGAFGMNTPAYFCMDNFTTTDGTVNAPPVAVQDTASVLYTDTLVVNVLANDTLASFPMHTVSIVSGPDVTGAIAYIDSNNNLVYIPVVGVRTVDTVVYSLCDEFDTCVYAQVIINIYGPVNTGILETDGISLELYPNPANTRFTIGSSSWLESLSIMDMSGREVMSVSVGQHSASIDISALSTGIYTVLTHTSDGIAARRLVKE